MYDTTHMTEMDKLFMSHPGTPGAKERVGWTDEEVKWGMDLHLAIVEELRIFMALEEGRPVTPEEIKHMEDTKKYLDEVYLPRKFPPGSVGESYCKKLDAFEAAHPELQIKEVKPVTDPPKKVVGRLH